MFAIEIEKEHSEYKSTLNKKGHGVNVKELVKKTEQRHYRAIIVIFVHV